MSTALTLTIILYGGGVIAYAIIGAPMIWEGKEDIHWQERRKRRGVLPVDEQRLRDARDNISFGLGIIKGGFIVWPLLLARSVKRNLREAERYTR